MDDGEESVSSYQLVFRIHALKRMSQRHIEKEDIRHIIETGTNIETYPNAFPLPARLVMGWRNQRCLHVVVADNVAAQEIIVISAYEPDPLEWEPDFKTRKQP